MLPIPYSSFTVALYLLCGASFAQQLGTIRKIDISTTLKVERYGTPWITKGMGQLTGYERVKGNEREKGIDLEFPLDGSAPPTERRWTRRAKLDGEVGATWFGTDDADGRLALLIWDKATGIVDLVHQRYDDETDELFGPQVKLGTIPLDPKSYKGAELWMRSYASPDSSRSLLYFDGIHSEGIKLAMCWVVDKEGATIWSGTYRLPVQALGAQTTIDFNDAGQVMVEVSAIVLDEENTHEKNDGTLKAEVEKNYMKKVSTTAYLLFGDQFLSWDGQLNNATETTFMTLVNTPAGWGFLASTRTGKRKDASHQWVLGRLDAGFKPEIMATGKLDAPLARALYKDADYHLISIQDDGLAVSQLGPDGTIAWRHVAPFPKEATMDDFRILADRLVYSHRWTKADVETLQKGKAPLGDMGVHYGIPTLLVWQNGQRTVTPLLPLNTKSKDLPTALSVHKEGMLMKMGALDDPSTAFLPFVWD